MHPHGLAVDVINWRQALSHLDAVGLCQPLPADDAVHVSHVDGTECQPAMPGPLLSHLSVCRVPPPT
jgi:hypothetical protein